MHRKTFARRASWRAATLAIATALWAPLAGANHGNQYNDTQTAWVGGYLGADGACDEACHCTYVYYCHVSGGGNNLGGILTCRDPAGVTHGTGPYDGGLTGEKSYNFYLPWIDVCEKNELEFSNLDMVGVNRPHAEGALPGGVAEKALHDFSWVCGVNLRPTGAS